LTIALVDLGAALDIVALDRQQLLQHVGRAVGFQAPDLHLAEALTTRPRLAAQRLLRDQAVRTRRAGVDLVIHQVVQLEHVDEADRDRLVERLARAAVDTA
jgi:hypothetical protein